MQPPRRFPLVTLPALWILAAASATVGCAQQAVSEARRPAPQWQQLFNGKDLTGWQVKIKGHRLGENIGDTFRVENGILKVAYDKYEKFDGRFGHLFHTRQFANYRLRVEYRFVGQQVPGGPGWAFRNSGLMIHGQTPESMAVDQNFPASIEVQLLGGREEGERPTANLCTPGTHVVMDGKLLKRHCTNSTSKTYRGDQWVTVEVEVVGNRIRHLVEGQVVLQYTDPQLDDSANARRALAAGQTRMLRRGTISLQSESHPVEFRKVELLELPDDAAWREPLTGGDLRKHWHTEGNWRLGKDGVVVLTPRAGERGWRRFGSYLWLNGTYRDFEVEFDYQVESKGNSGFYFHVGDEQQPVQRGIEVQIYDSHGKPADRRLTDHDSGGIIPGLPPTRNAARPAGEWNHFRIVCRGDDLTVELNGTVVNRVKLSHPRLQGRPSAGSIGFQDHGLPLRLRAVRIRPL